MHSQSNEEQVLLDYFGARTGRLLDVGASDGIVRSNSKQLIDNGWSAVLVEPDPFAVSNLIKNTTSAQADIVNACIAPKRGITRFHSAYGDGISTTDDMHRDKWLATGGTFKSIYVPTLTINDLFDLFGHRFEFVTIDTESTNLMVLKQMPLKAMGVEVLCIEHDDCESDIGRFCQPAGLTQQIFHSRENLILAKPK